MPNKKSTISKSGLLLTALALIGFIASFVLTIEKIELLKNPGYIPPCNISPLLSCGSVMKTAQAEAFGFSNTLIGLAFFAAATAVGLAVTAGAKFQRWFWLGFQLCLTAATAFIYWLAYQSIFVIGTLCPYCMIVWAVTIPLALYAKLYGLRVGYITYPKQLNGLVAWNQKYHWVPLIALYAILVIPIVVKFWWYWSSLIS